MPSTPTLGGSSVLDHLCTVSTTQAHYFAEELSDGPTSERWIKFIRWWQPVYFSSASFSGLCPANTGGHS